MRPIPGKQYTIFDENNLSLVAQRAYGDATFWRRIWNANQTILRSGDPDLIFPGETILIPLLPERQLPDSVDRNKDPNGIYIEIDGHEIRPQTCSVLRTLDTVANAFRAVIPWQRGDDPAFDELIKPRSYSPIKISIGSERILTGTLYSSPATKTVKGTTLSLIGYSSTVDLVDSSLRPPYEFNNIRLEDLIQKVIEPDGFSFLNQAGDTGGEFDRVTAARGQKKFEFLRNFSRQRGVLITNDVFDKVILLRSELTGNPVATFEEDVTLGVTGWNGLNVDGREFFNVYRATGDSPFGSIEGKSIDNKVPRSRFTDVRANESTAGNIDTAARWARNKRLGDALSFPLTVEDWRDPQGNLYKENTFSTIVSPTNFIDGFNFLINQVEYRLGSNGRSSVLSFVPPSVYTQGEIIEPW